MVGHDWCAAWLAAALIAGSVGHGVASAEPVRLGGTGAALAAMRRVADDFTTASPANHVEVLPSMGTRGGLRALEAKVIDIALTGRRLEPGERAQGMTEAACFATALVLVSSRQGPPGIARADLPRLYAEPRPIWPDGMPLKAILRSRSGSEIPYLAGAVPGLGEAFDAAFMRPDMPVAATDQENAELAQKIVGSLGFATLLQVSAEHLDLRVLSLDGVAPTAATITDRTYPLRLPICLVTTAMPAPAAAAFLAYVGSTAGRAVLASLGAVAGD